MRYEVEELGRWRRRLAIRVPVSTTEQVHRSTVRAFARRAKLKGYRPGKAPERLIERQYGPEIDQEVVKQLVREGFEKSVSESGLEPIATPRFENVHRTEDGGFEFTAEFDIRPEIELGRTTGFRIEREVREVEDADVDRVLDRLRHERSDWRSVDRPSREGDRVVFASSPIGDDGETVDSERIEDQRAELGAEGLLPEFEEGLAGVRPGDERTITVAFPDHHPNETLQGVRRAFEVSITAVEERVLPDLDDTFAATIGNFDSVGAARDQIRANLEAELEIQSRRDVNEQLVDEIISANSIDLPESMIEQYLDNMLGDQPGLGSDGGDRATEIRAALRPGAERALRRYYILNHVADREGLRATDGDVDAAIAERAPSESAIAETRRRLQRSGEIDDLRFHLTMERVFDWLRQQSEITPDLPPREPRAVEAQRS